MYDCVLGEQLWLLNAAIKKRMVGLMYTSFAWGLN
jgi:hypothetical protein